MAKTVHPAEIRAEIRTIADLVSELARDIDEALAPHTSGAVNVELVGMVDDLAAFVRDAKRRWVMLTDR